MLIRDLAALEIKQINKNLHDATTIRVMLYWNKENFHFNWSIAFWKIFFQQLLQYMLANIRGLGIDDELFRAFAFTWNILPYKKREKMMHKHSVYTDLKRTETAFRRCSAKYIFLKESQNKRFWG